MYLGFQGLRAVALLLPLGAAQVLGRAIGRLAYWLLPGQRRLTLTHLEQAFGASLEPGRRVRIARGVFENLGQNIMEWLLLPKLSQQALQRQVACEGLEHLREALRKGSGVIGITAHFGNWELIALYLSSLGFEGAVLARRLRYPEYESFLVTLRAQRGVPTLARGSVKEVAKVLRANHIVGMLPDQDIDSLEGIFVDFFGHPAYTPVGPAALSVMTGAPIVPCFLLREAGGYRLMIEPPVPMPQTNDRAQAIRELTQAWSRVVESYLRRAPDHWVWMHRRWKTQLATSNQQQATRRQATGQPAIVVALVACCLSLVTAVTGCGKSQPPAPGAKPTAGSAADATSSNPDADQEMSGFTLTGYEEDGTKRWELTGSGANMDGQLVTIQHPDGIGYDPQRTAWLTASAAEVDQTTRHVRMEHDVTIHTSDGLWFTSPILHWIPDQDQMATDQPVRIETDHMLLRGRGAHGRTNLKLAIIERDIEMVLNPSDQDLPRPGPKQVKITCDGPLSFDYQNHIATFEQNVHVKDPSGDLYSDKLVAYLDETTHTIRYAEATGHVRIHQNQNTANSERAIYEPAIGKITLVGRPSLLVYPNEGGSQEATLSFGGLVDETSPRTASPNAATTD